MPIQRCFIYAQALLRLERHIPYKEKMERVDEVIAELSLAKCQNTIIGVPGRMKGLSGGERKRLAFASEALTDPTLLLCDEPTSGLDSFMAHNVLQVLKRLAQKGKTIILTIHQPSSEIFSLFDKLLLMAEGRVAFIGAPAAANQFFAQMNAPCPNNYNPADFYVELLAIVPGSEDESRLKIRKICDAFAVSDVSTKLNETINEIQRGSDDYFFGAANGNGIQRYRASWFTQFRAILWRSWSTVLKEPLLVRVRLMQTVVSTLSTSSYRNILPLSSASIDSNPPSDGVAGRWRDIFRPATDAGRSDEHQRSHLFVPHQHDVPECLFRGQCMSLSFPPDLNSILILALLRRYFVPSCLYFCASIGVACTAPTRTSWVNLWPNCRCSCWCHSSSSRLPTR